MGSRCAGRIISEKHCAADVDSAQRLACAGAYLQDCHVQTPSNAAEDMDMAKALWLETELQLGSAEAKLALK